MKFEIKWSPDDKPMARRMDGCIMTDNDRREVRVLIEKMERREVCFNCGAEWTVFTNSAAQTFRVCDACAKLSEV